MAPTMKPRRGTRLASTLLVYFLVSVSGGLPHRWGFVRGDDAVGIACRDAATDTVCAIPHGGWVGSEQDKLAAAEERISRYLEESRENGGKFHVQGWRWHTMSLVREAGRLQKLSSRMQASCRVEELPALRMAADYVVGFNMKGLHKIEKDLFFPWVRGKFNAIGESDVVKAFSVIMDQLESDRKTIELLGSSLDDVVSIASDPTISEPARSKAMRLMTTQSAAIAEHTRLMLQREDSFLVPGIARIVPEAEQKSFNNKVIRMLGVFDSRMHLVGMHEAVWELENKKERELFQEAIPSIPQYMIPRWKRLLYEPRVGILDKV